MAQHGNEQFAEQLQAVHSPFYTFMVFQHVKKQLGFMRMQYQQYFLVIKDQRDYLTIRQRGRVVYELIVNEGAARVDYLFRDNEAELSNCFSIHSYPKYKL